MKRSVHQVQDVKKFYIAHITELRLVCYPWHPWCGHAVTICAARVRRDRTVFHCILGVSLPMIKGFFRTLCGIEKGVPKQHIRIRNIIAEIALFTTEAVTDAARQGAPQAVQVADHGHWLKNLRTAVEQLLSRYHTLASTSQWVVIGRDQQKR